jgi:hypothetical protein
MFNERIATWSELPIFMKKKRIPKGWKLVLQGLPLAGAAATSFLPLQRWGQQFLILIALLWVQVFFIIEYLFVGK